MLIFIIVGIHCAQIANRQIQLTKIANSTSIGNEGNYYYYLGIGLGTPPQYFNVLIDTGSNVLWITNSTCVDCQINTRFYINESSTYVDLNQTAEIDYAMGECSGVASTDVIEILGTPIDIDFEFLLVNNESDFNFAAGVVGLMGLSNKQSQQNVFQIAYKAGQIESQLFGFEFSHTLLDNYLFYGEFNQSVLDETIWIKTNLDNRWSLKLIGMYANDQQYTITENEAIFDSGTTCIYLQTSIYNSIYTEYFNCNECDCSQSYPNLTFYFQGAKVTVTQDQYMEQLANGKCSVCLGATDSFNVLGDPFLQTFIPIFNKEESKIGLYQTQELQQVNTFLCPLFILIIDGVMLLMIFGYLFSYFRLRKIL